MAKSAEAVGIGLFAVSGKPWWWAIIVFALKFFARVTRELGVIEKLRTLAQETETPWDDKLVDGLEVVIEWIESA